MNLETENKPDEMRLGLEIAKQIIQLARTNPSGLATAEEKAGDDLVALEKELEQLAIKTS